MKKQTLPYQVTTAEDGTTRALMVNEVYGSVLPNALQNAVLETAQAVSDLAVALKIDLPAFDDLFEHLIDGLPVLQGECSSELIIKTMLNALHELHAHRLFLLTTRRLQDTADVTAEAGTAIAA